METTLSIAGIVIVSNIPLLLDWICFAVDGTSTLYEKLRGGDYTNVKNERLQKLCERCDEYRYLAMEYFAFAFSAFVTAILAQVSDTTINASALAILILRSLATYNYIFGSNGKLCTWARLFLHLASMFMVSFLFYMSFQAHNTAAPISAWRQNYWFSYLSAKLLK